jgi:hypothetical protein
MRKSHPIRCRKEATLRRTWLHRHLKKQAHIFSLQSRLRFLREHNMAYGRPYISLQAEHNRLVGRRR